MTTSILINTGEEQPRVIDGTIFEYFHDQVTGILTLKLRNVDINRLQIPNLTTELILDDNE